MTGSLKARQGIVNTPWRQGMLCKQAYYLMRVKTGSREKGIQLTKARLDGIICPCYRKSVSKNDL